MMVLRQIYTAGFVFGSHKEEEVPQMQLDPEVVFEIQKSNIEDQTGVIKNFLLCISLCHSATVTKNSFSKKTEFASTSEDESALLRGAAQV
jgi:magnesium-transporting ATPase (P-type)